MNPWPVEADVDEVHLPRPGHADLAGVQKYGFTDVRNVLERASARETAARVAAGALAKVSCVRSACRSSATLPRSGPYARRTRRADPCRLCRGGRVAVRCLDEEGTQAMVEQINTARKANESLGGVYEVIAFGVTPGLGSDVAGTRAWTAAWPRRSCPSRR